MEQLQAPTMGVTINKKSTTTEPHESDVEPHKSDVEP